MPYSLHEEQLPHDVLLPMVYIPGGSFFMGSPEDEQGRSNSEGPLHRVSVSAFYMGQYSVTQEQWYSVWLWDKVDRELEANPSCYKKGKGRPVDSVSWHDAREFCKRLSQNTAYEYRLPSEAEWEYACRAGSVTPYSYGNFITDTQANINGTGTKSVGQYPPNSFGLYDMHGNVREWCRDHWHENYTHAPLDGSAWIEGGESSISVLRGGSWFDSLPGCRSASRYKDFSTNGFNLTGFRVCYSFPRVQ